MRLTIALIVCAGLAMTGCRDRRRSASPAVSTALRAAPPVSLAPPATTRPAEMMPDHITVYSHDHPGNAAVEAKLDQPLGDVIFARGTRVEDAFTWLAKRTGVSIEPNWPAMEQLGYTKNHEVTLTLKNSTARAVLRRILYMMAGRFGVLDFVVRDGLVVVSHNDDLDQRRSIRIYDVNCLLAQTDPYAPGVEDGVYSNRAISDFKEAIRKFVQPDSWTPSGTADMSETRGLLVVRQTDRGHRELLEFFELQRRAMAGRAGNARPVATRPTDEGMIRGVRSLLRYPQTLDFLLKHDFAISPESGREMADFYADDPRNPLPYFVTTDAMLHAYNVIYSDAVKKLEERQGEDLGKWQRQLWNRVSQARPAYLSDAEMKHLRGLVAVGFKLFDARFKPKGDLPAWVDQEVAKAMSANATEQSPAWGRQVDYSAFKPGGFYAGDAKLEAMWRATVWWSRYPFRGENAAEVRMAAELGLLVNADAPAYRRQLVAYAELLGKSEGVTLRDMHQATADAKKDGAADVPAVAAAKLAKTSASRVRIGDGFDELRGPGALNIVVLPPRYSFDSEVLTLVTQGDALREHHLPGGLDVMAGMGGERPRRLLLDGLKGTHVHDALSRQIDAARSLRGERNKLLSDICLQRDKVIESLLEPEATDRHPAFMQNEPYKLKSLQTALAGWAEDRHRWQLHLPMTGMFGGLPEEPPVKPPPGYVEPNLPFWDRMIELTRLSRQRLANQNVEEDSRWKVLEGALVDCQQICETQLAGERLSTAQTQRLEAFPDTYDSIGRSKGTAGSGDPVVAAIGREAAGGAYLHVGTGYPQAIYAVFEYGGRRWLCRGGAMTYREMYSGMMNDADWRKLLESREAPPPQKWILETCPKPVPPATTVYYVDGEAG